MQYNLARQTAAMALLISFLSGESDPELFDLILNGYQSVVDPPAAIHPADTYAAYPDAKFILVSINTIIKNDTVPDNYCRLFGILLVGKKA